jgi:hypothetical protein
VRIISMALAGALTALAVSVCPVAAADITAEDIAKAMGFNPADYDKLRAGEILSSEIEETTEKQLAVALAVLVPAQLDAIAADIAKGTTIEANKAIQAHGEIDPANVSEASFAGITLGSDEVEKLVEVEPGSDYNLSSDEIAIFQNLGDQSPEAVNAAWRQILAARTQAYLQSGLAGIAPYDRGGDTSSAADDLRAAAEGSKVLQQAVPELYQAFLAYPDQQVEGVQNQFLWTQQEADDRPVYVLTHRMLQQSPDLLVLMSRDFYVSHSFNASQGAAGALPVQDGTIVFYANRTSSDQVAGFMSGMRHEIGRGMMRDSLVEAMEQIRAATKP